MCESLLNISKALRCSICNKYIVSYEGLHKYNTCSMKCCNKKYQHDYYLKITKPKRGSK